VLAYGGNILQVTRVREAIEVDEAPNFWTVNEVMDDIGSDKACAAGHKDIHERIRLRVALRRRFPVQ
jgi:hypothetical protein